jgi:TetR/AcrR family transcriptional regulator, cholesterol catabolism regulator
VAGMKDTIKRVSIDLFHKQGYFATGISDIARASGIQKASIYYHYANKEDILFDIFKTTMIDLDANLENALKGAKGTEGKVQAAIRSHVIFHIDRQKEVFISDSELRGLTVDNYKTIIDLRDKYEKKFQALIRTGIREGVFSNLDSKVTSYGMITMCTAVSIWFRPSGRLSREDIANIYADFIVKGLKRRR